MNFGSPTGSRRAAIQHIAQEATDGSIISKKMFLWDIVSLLVINENLESAQVAAFIAYADDRLDVDATTPVLELALAFASASDKARMAVRTVVSEIRHQIEEDIVACLEAHEVELKTLKTEISEKPGKTSPGH
jgi:hypothetical protein